MTYEDMNRVVSQAETDIADARRERLRTLVPYNNGDAVKIQFTKKVDGKYGRPSFTKGQIAGGTLSYCTLTPAGKNANVSIRDLTGVSKFSYTQLLTDKFKWI